MKKAFLLTRLLLTGSLFTSCTGFDNSGNRPNGYEAGGGNYGSGHSHH